MADLIPVPIDVVDSVERYVDSELDQAKKYDNRTPLDESGVYTLHQLVARVYQAGWDAGAMGQMHKESRLRQRIRDEATG